MKRRNPGKEISSTMEVVCTTCEETFDIETGDLIKVPIDPFEKRKYKVKCPWCNREVTIKYDALDEGIRFQLTD